MFKTKNTYYLAKGISKKTITATFPPSLFKKTISCSLHIHILLHYRTKRSVEGPRICSYSSLQCIPSIKI